MASDLLHADDTPIRVLDKSLRDRGPRKGREEGPDLGLCARPAALGGYRATRSGLTLLRRIWKEEHVHRHLANTRGILQADGYTRVCQTL